MERGKGKPFLIGEIYKQKTEDRMKPCIQQEGDWKKELRDKTMYPILHKQITEVNVTTTIICKNEYTFQ